MTPEVRLASGERRRSILNAYPAPPVRVRIPPRTVHAKPRDTAQPGPDASDDLRAARGIVFLGLCGVGLWTLVGLAYWLIAR